MDEDDRQMNRRKFPRVRYPCLIVIRNGADGKDEMASTLLTHTENVGVGGVCVNLKEQIKIYSMISIELDLLDLEDHVVCQGKVVWCTQRDEAGSYKSRFYDVGIEFDNLSDQDKLRIGKIIDRLEKNVT